MGQGDPSRVSRLVARMRKEVPALELEAFRRAGAAVFDLCLLAEAKRSELAAAGRHPWEADPATASILICSWNARLHQTFASELLDADYRDDPRTAGFVPPVTARQAWAFFKPVQRWLSAGQRAAANPGFWIGEEVDLPAPLPPLLRSRSASRSHLRGLLTAADAVDRLLEESLGAVVGAGEPPAQWRGQLERIRELAAQAQSALRYAQALWHPATSDELERVIVQHLQPALLLEHHIGQFLALPELLDGYRIGTRATDRWNVSI
jgi:hypothetical protein